MKLNKVGLFLDRDGTINTEVDFLTSPDELHLYPSASRVIREANALGVRVIVMTNQSGIARGYLTEADLKRIHGRLIGLVEAEGATIDAIYFCPHHPTTGNAPYVRNCDCRKPKPGMIMQGIRAFGLDPARSFVIGDRCVDMEAGRAAGCTTGLVLTGYGETEQQECTQRRMVDHTGKDVGAVWNTFKSLMKTYA